MAKIAKAGDGKPIPPDAEIVDFTFIPGRLIDKYPAMCRSPEETLNAFIAEVPGQPREVCAILALQFMEVFVAPVPGHEEAYIRSIQYLKNAAGQWKVEDHTGGQLEDAKKENNWRDS